MSHTHTPDMVNRLCKRILLVNCKFVRRMPVLTWNVRNFYEKFAVELPPLLLLLLLLLFAVAIVLREWAGSFEPSVCTQTHAHCTRFELPIVYAISTKISISIILSLSRCISDSLSFVLVRCQEIRSHSMQSARCADDSGVSILPMEHVLYTSIDAVVIAIIIVP